MKEYIKTAEPSPCLPPVFPLSSLAMLYQHPTQKNYQEAYKYAEFSAQKGVMEGELLFAIFLYYGRGCNADEDKAYKYFVRAYEHGMTAAKIYLDKLYKEDS